MRFLFWASKALARLRESRQAARNLALWQRWGGIVAPLLLLTSGAELVYWTPPTMQAAPLEAVPIFLEAVFHSSLALWLLWALLRARLSASSTRLWLLSVAICFWYIWITPYTVRGYDAPGHLSYVEIIAIGLRFPSPGDCWVCYHPPLYYLAVAPFFRVFLVTPHFSAPKELQILGGYLFAAALLYFFRLAEAVVENRRDRILALLLIIFLPVTMLSSGRIGNDVLAYFLWMAAVYHAALWEDTLDAGRLIRAFVFLSLGFVTKMSIAVPAAAVLATIVTTMLRRTAHRRTIVRQCALASVLPILSLIGYFYWSRSFIRQGITGNIQGMWWKYRVHPTFEKAMTFHLGRFLTGFAYPKTDAGGREYFWVYWLKTGLIGAWTFDQTGAATATRGLSFFCLALIALAAATAILYRRHLLRTTPTVLLWITVLSPLASLKYWMDNAYSSSGDARYVYPVFPAAALVFARLQAGARDNGNTPLLVAGYVAEALFIVCGACFVFAVLTNVSL